VLIGKEKISSPAQAWCSAAFFLDKSRMPAHIRDAAVQQKRIKSEASNGTQGKIA
jgi:hypothetical protein